MMDRDILWGVIAVVGFSLVLIIILAMLADMGVL